MSATITLTDIPDDLYEQIKLAATANHRSINEEIFVCLERALPRAPHSKISNDEQISRARRIRESIKAEFTSADILNAIDAGRETQ